MRIVVITDRSGRVVGAAVCNGDEKTLTDIENRLDPTRARAHGVGLVDIRCQVVDADTLSDLDEFVAERARYR